MKKRVSARRAFNNRGASLMMVLVAMAALIIMGTTFTALAMRAYNTSYAKLCRQQAKYTAESIFESAYAEFYENKPLQINMLSALRNKADEVELSFVTDPTIISIENDTRLTDEEKDALVLARQNVIMQENAYVEMAVDLPDVSDPTGEITAVIRVRYADVSRSQLSFEAHGSYNGYTEIVRGLITQTNKASSELSKIFGNSMFYKTPIINQIVHHINGSLYIDHPGDDDNIYQNIYSANGGQRVYTQWMNYWGESWSSAADVPSTASDPTAWGNNKWIEIFIRSMNNDVRYETPFGVFTRATAINGDLVVNATVGDDRQRDWRSCLIGLKDRPGRQHGNTEDVPFDCNDPQHPLSSGLTVNGNAYVRGHAMVDNLFLNGSLYIDGNANLDGDCNSLGLGSVQSGDRDLKDNGCVIINGDVIVNGDCTIKYARISGNVIVNGGRLTISNTTDIRGDVVVNNDAEIYNADTDGRTCVDLTNARIGGTLYANVVANNGNITSSQAVNRLNNCAIGGNVYYLGDLEMNGTTVGGDLRCDGGLTASGGSIGGGAHAETGMSLSGTNVGGRIYVDKGRVKLVGSGGSIGGGIYANHTSGDADDKVINISGWGNIGGDITVTSSKKDVDGVQAEITTNGGTVAGNIYTNVPLRLLHTNVNGQIRVDNSRIYINGGNLSSAYVPSTFEYYGDDKRIYSNSPVAGYDPGNHSQWIADPGSLPIAIWTTGSVMMCGLRNNYYGGVYAGGDFRWLSEGEGGLYYSNIYGSVFVRGNVYIDFNIKYGTNKNQRLARVCGSIITLGNNFSMWDTTVWVGVRHGKGGSRNISNSYIGDADDDAGNIYAYSILEIDIVQFENLISGKTDMYNYDKQSRFFFTPVDTLEPRIIGYPENCRTMVDHPNESKYRRYIGYEIKRNDSGAIIYKRRALNVDWADRLAAIRTWTAPGEALAEEADQGKGVVYTEIDSWQDGINKGVIKPYKNANSYIIDQSIKCINRFIVPNSTKLYFNTAGGILHAKLLGGLEVSERSQILLTGGYMVFMYFYRDTTGGNNDPRLTPETSDVYIGPYANIGRVERSAGQVVRNDSLYLISNDSVTISFGKDATMNGYVYFPRGYLNLSEAHSGNETLLNGCIAVGTFCMPKNVYWNFSDWWNDRTTAKTALQNTVFNHTPSPLIIDIKGDIAYGDSTDEVVDFSKSVWEFLGYY